MNPTESKYYFENIKSNFILKRIFNYIKKIKLLEIVKYNKKLQERLNKTLDDYKEYSQLYSSIEIELKTAYKGEFINISNENKKYYHIYFDNANEEIKRNYLEEKDNVKIIRIIINYQVTSFKNLFDNCENINAIILLI